jgi:hypothetical protein
MTLSGLREWPSDAGRSSVFRWQAIAQHTQKNQFLLDICLFLGIYSQIRHGTAETACRAYNETLMTENLHNSLFAAVIKLLRPLVRILLRNGVSHRTFGELSKWVYVDVARQEFSIKGRKQSTSRISVLTGLSRKEVQRVRQLPRPDDRASAEKYNRAARVIAAWRREKEFSNKRHTPSSLPIKGPGATFTTLVKKFSGDMPVRAILDELIRIGAVEQLEDGTVRLMVRAYIPEMSETDKLNILGTDVAHLINTIGHNLNPKRTRTFFQRKVEYDNLPDDILPDFKTLAEDKAQDLLEELDRWLARHDRDVNPMVKGSGRNRAGLGIYYFEKPYMGGDS